MSSQVAEDIYTVREEKPANELFMSLPTQTSGDYDSWLAREVQAGLEQAERGEFASPQAVDSVFEKYGIR